MNDLLVVVRAKCVCYQGSQGALIIMAFLETDDSARAVFTRRREQDRQIAVAVQEIPLPSGLKDRLRLALFEEKTTEATVVVENRTNPRTSRRRWLASRAASVWASSAFTR